MGPILAPKTLKRRSVMKNGNQKFKEYLEPMLAPTASLASDFI